MGWLEEGIELGCVRAAAAGADVLARGRSTGSCRAPSPVRCRRRRPSRRLGRQPIVDDRFGELRVGRDRRAVAGGSDGGRRPTPLRWKGERPWPT